MFGRSVVRANGLVKNARCFRSTALSRDAKPVATSAAPKSVDPEQVIGAKMHRVTNFDRWMLVWMKKFPNKEAVPDKITIDLLHHTQSRARIRTANLMMIGTVIGCLWAVISGKREAASGKSMIQENKDWHAQMNQEYKASLAQPKTT